MKKQTPKRWKIKHKSVFDYWTSHKYQIAYVWADSEIDAEFKFLDHHYVNVDPMSQMALYGLIVTQEV